MTTADALFGRSTGPLRCWSTATRSCATWPPLDHRAALLEELQAEHGKALRGRLRRQGAGRGRGPGPRRPLAGVRARRRPGGLLAVLASPIPYSEQAVGVVAVLAGEPHAWTEAEREASPSPS